MIRLIGYDRTEKILLGFPGIWITLLLSGCFLCDMATAGNLPGLRTETGTIPWDSASISQSEKVIYGTDDRIDVYQETHAGRVGWAASTCAIVYASDLTAAEGEMYSLTAYTYRVSGYPACSGEPFSNQPTAAFCTAFMVGDDLIATAGHCLTASDLSSIRFLFGFDMLNGATPKLSFHADQIYTGIEVVHHGGTGDFDHAIVRLDRSVVAPGATPLPLRRTGTIPVGDTIGVIGHPSGLPKKIAFGVTTTVRDNQHPGYFTANLDTYGGNSGSPVFNAITGLVEGILVRGAADFILESSCFRSNEFSDTAGLGEDVTKSTAFESYVPGENEGEGEPFEGENEGEGEPFEGENEGEGEPFEGENEGEGELFEGESEGEGESELLLVPNLINLTPAIAQSILESKGFVLGSVTEKYDEAVAADRVISQDPEAGTSALPGAAIAITASLGSKFAMVPDVVGKDLTAAETALTEAGLLLGTVTKEYDPVVVLGHVVLQSPSASSAVDRSSKVAVTLSKGAEPVVAEGEVEGEEGEGESVEGDQGLWFDCNNSGNTDVTVFDCGGCNMKKGISNTGCVKKLLGDWLLIGLALLTLFSFSGITKGN